jgi:hypothetical protein
MEAIREGNDGTERIVKSYRRRERSDAKKYIYDRLQDKIKDKSWWTALNTVPDRFAAQLLTGPAVVRQESAHHEYWSEELIIKFRLYGIASRRAVTAASIRNSCRIQR